MTNSPTNPHVLIKEQRESEVPEDDEQLNMDTTQIRICDFCGESLALLYCKADSAKLCLSCDREVHSTNQLFTKHTRWRLCDSCDSSPASILCSTDNFVVCQNCDWETHNRSVSSLHDRRPLDGFTGCPTVTELLTIVGFEDANHKGLFGDDGSADLGNGFEDLLEWDTPSVLSLDDLIASTDSVHNFQAIGCPSLPKSRNVASGQYKEEMLRQLHELAKLEPNFNDDHGVFKPLMGFQSHESEEDLRTANMYLSFEKSVELDVIPSYELETSDQWDYDYTDLANQGFQSMLLESYNEENCFVPEKDSEIGCCESHVNGDYEEKPHLHIVTTTLQVIPKVAAHEFTSEERDSAISRYKQKRKTRRYDRHIRYESRKARAESRTRINGRFAKMDH